MDRWVVWRMGTCTPPVGIPRDGKSGRAPGPTKKHRKTKSSKHRSKLYPNVRSADASGWNSARR